MVIAGNVTIGEGNHFFQGCSIGAQPQDHKWQGEDTNVIIGNNNVFRENVSVHRGTKIGGGTTKIGDHNFFMVHSHIAHDCNLGSHITFANCATLSGHVTIEDMVTLSGLTGVHQFCRIGKLAFAAGGAIVTQDIPPFVIAQGDRARIVGLNSVGLRRQGIKTPLVTELRKAYRGFWRSTAPLKDRLALTEEQFPENSLVKHMVDFIATSKRGVIGPRKGIKSELEE